MSEVIERRKREKTKMSVQLNTVRRIRLTSTAYDELSDAIKENFLTPCEHDRYHSIVNVDISAVRNIVAMLVDLSIPFEYLVI